MNFSDFTKSVERRKIYWARNYVSWPRFSSFKPNKTHDMLAKWEKTGKVIHHVTQNVDSLLVKAGSTKLTELHGSSFKVICLTCDFKMSRESMQILIKSLNPNWNVFSDKIRPDNDARLDTNQINDFVLPKCPKCQNYSLKPDVSK